MTYNIISTEEMDSLLDNCVGYLLNKFKSKQSVEHLLVGVSDVYDTLENNPDVYRVSQDPFMKAMKYHEAKVPGMDYMIVYKIVDRNVYIMGIFHTLENYADKMKIIWGTFKP